jgi:hypothetical protein
MAKIKFIRKYEFYGSTAYEVIYMSGRIVSFRDTQTEKMPATVKAFLDGKQPREQYDKLFKRTEYIYE